MNWKNITLAKYQQIDEINSRDISAIDKVLYSLCVVKDKTEYEIDNEQPKKVLGMMQELQKLFESPLNARPIERVGRYVINYDVSKITLGQYIELAYFIANNPERHGHYILATMSNVWLRKYVSVNHRKRAEYFFKQPVELVLGSVKKIIESFIEFNKQYTNLFGADTEDASSVDSHEFNKRYGWIYSATQVAQHEGIKLDEAFALPIRQAFNDLLFLKAKGRYELEQLRKSNKSIA